VPRRIDPGQIGAAPIEELPPVESCAIQPAELDFNSVVAAVAGAARVMNVIALDERVCGAALPVVTADVHPFALGGAARAQAGVMNVIAADHERVAVAAVHGERVVAGLEDLAPFEGHVMSADESHPGAAALESQAADDEMGAIDELKGWKTAGV
jgi:hypothetical protein